MFELDVVEDKVFEEKQASIRQMREFIEACGTGLFFYGQQGAFDITQPDEKNRQNFGRRLFESVAAQFTAIADPRQMTMDFNS